MALEIESNLCRLLGWKVSVIHRAMMHSSNAEYLNALPLRRSTMVFFDPQISTKGALLSASKSFRPVDHLSVLLKERSLQASSVVTGEILTPNALPMYRDPERVTKRKREKELMDPIKSHRPEPPASGIRTGGKSSVSVNFAQFVADATTKTRKKMAGVDPREELFKYREGKNYTGDDGPVILAEKTVEEEEEEMKAKK